MPPHSVNFCFLKLFLEKTHGQPVQTDALAKHLTLALKQGGGSHVSAISGLHSGSQRQMVNDPECCQGLGLQTLLLLLVPLLGSIVGLRLYLHLVKIQHVLAVTAIHFLVMPNASENAAGITNKISVKR